MDDELIRRAWQLDNETGQDTWSSDMAWICDIAGGSVYVGGVWRVRRRCMEGRGDKVDSKDTRVCRLGIGRLERLEVTLKPGAVSPQSPSPSPRRLQGQTRPMSHHSAPTSNPHY